MSRLILGMIFVLPAMAVQAGSGQYHVCTGTDGKKTFTSEPCAQDQKAEIRTYNVQGGSEKSQRLSTDNPIYLQMKSDNRKIDIERAVKKHNKSIEEYSSRMESELSALKKKKLSAKNNRAGATWEISISEEMNAVTSKYTTLIGVERDQINDLKSELANL